MTEEFVERCCEVMHDAYEKAADEAGWETNPASRKPWTDVPEANKVTMRAAVQALLRYLIVAVPRTHPVRTYGAGTTSAGIYDTPMGTGSGPS